MKNAAWMCEDRRRGRELSPSQQLPPPLSVASQVDIVRDYTDPRGTQIPPMTGLQTEAFFPADPRYTQPYLATLLNHGFYRIQVHTPAPIPSVFH